MNSRNLEIRSDVIATTFESTYLSAKSLKSKYLEVLGIDEADIFSELDNIFDKINSNNDDFGYQQILSKQVIKDGLLFIRTLPNLEEEANKCSNEFAKMLKEFLESYIEILETPIRENWSNDEIDRSKLNEMISKLTSFKASNIKESSILTPNGIDSTFLVTHFADNIERYVA